MIKNDKKHTKYLNEKYKITKNKANLKNELFDKWTSKVKIDIKSKIFWLRFL